VPPVPGLAGANDERIARIIRHIYTPGPRE
jgi:hypothetical protein